MSFVKIKYSYCIIAGLLFCNSFFLSAQIPSREYQIKAAFLFNFTQFIEWPPNTFTDSQSPFTICILGANPFGSFLEETVKGEKAGGRPLIIKFCKTPDDIKTCQVLFVNFSDTKEQAAIIKKASGLHILTVSDAPGFITQGGMVRFFTKQNKMQFQINTDATKAANLTVSSKILRLADITSKK